MATVACPKERPILFSSPMVRAIQAARKTQTRRIMKPQPLDLRSPPHPGESDAVAMICEDVASNWTPAYCPYGHPGDRLWVRETWALVRPWYDHDTGYVDDVEEWSGPVPDRLPDGWRVWYAADSDDIHEHRDDRLVKRWRPSIFMPRWASRLTLEIVGARVDLLQRISEADANAEGSLAWIGSLDGRAYDEAEKAWCRWSKCLNFDATVAGARGAFAVLWEKINGEGSWDANPWVWVVSFRQTEVSL